MHRLVRVTTVPLSLEKLLEGQLTFMDQFYNVTAISADKERLEKFGRDNEVNIFWVNLTREITPVADLKAVFKLYRYFKREKPLIVHTHTPKAGITGMLAAKLAGVPIRLHTVAGLPLLESSGGKRKLLNLVEKVTCDCATKIYPNSRGLKEIILKEGFTSPEKLKVLGNGSSNGIDTEYFDPSLYTESHKKSFREALGIPATDIVFIFVGRLVAHKGINELLSSFTKLQEQYSNISLLLVGPFEQELNPITEENFERIENHAKIFSVGYREDVRPYFAISDILAFPSYREGFPNVVMQAGAMNIPSIVTDINGCNEIIKDHDNGLVIPPKDEEALFLAMNHLLEHSEERVKMALKAREEITQYYDRKRFWQELLREYKKLESENPKPYLRPE